MYVVFCKIDHCINIHWCIPMGLGHNDLWAESHMWPQQMWSQRSSRGQWLMIQVFWKTGHCRPYSHTLTYFHGIWIRWSLDGATHVALTEVGSKVILGSLTFWGHHFLWNRGHEFLKVSWQYFCDPLFDDQKFHDPLRSYNVEETCNPKCA